MLSDGAENERAQQSACLHDSKMGDSILGSLLRITQSLDHHPWLPSAHMLALSEDTDWVREGILFWRHPK